MATTKKPKKNNKASLRIADAANQITPLSPFKYDVKGKTLRDPITGMTPSEWKKNNDYWKNKGDQVSKPRKKRGKKRA